MSNGVVLRSGSSPPYCPPPGVRRPVSAVQMSVPPGPAPGVFSETLRARVVPDCRPVIPPHSSRDRVFLPFSVLRWRCDQQERSRFSWRAPAGHGGTGLRSRPAPVCVCVCVCVGVGVYVCVSLRVFCVTVGAGGADRLVSSRLAALPVNTASACVDCSVCVDSGWRCRRQTTQVLLFWSCGCVCGIVSRIAYILLGFCYSLTRLWGDSYHGTFSAWILRSCNMYLPSTRCPNPCRGGGSNRDPGSKCDSGWQAFYWNVRRISYGTLFPSKETENILKIVSCLVRLTD